MFEATRSQGKDFDTLVPPADGRFYAFLSKADYDELAKTWDVLFEMVNRGWMENVVFGRAVAIRAPLPEAPALLFHIRDAKEDELLKALRIDSGDQIVEGSWYLLTLTPGSKGIAGDLYDPDIDTVPGLPPPSQDSV